MQNIEQYYGDRPILSSEKVVLSCAIEWLSAHDVPAVIYTNVKFGINEIDILVATPNTTLVIEVKGYRNPVIGRENGPWQSTNPLGQIKNHTNGYAQVLRTYRALKNSMARKQGHGTYVSYPQGAVIFEGGIPAGSDLFTPPDERVVIAGIEHLEVLLAAKSKRPWPLEWVRDLAIELNLVRRDALCTDTSTAPNPNKYVAKASPLAVVPATKPVLEEVAERSVVSMPAPAYPRSESSIRQAEGPVVISSNLITSVQDRNANLGKSNSGHRRRRSLLFYAGLLLVFLLTITVIQYVRVKSPPDLTAKPAASLPTAHLTRHEAETRSTRHLQHSAAHVPPKVPQDPIGPASRTVIVPQVPAEPLPTIAPTEPITCPPGVDRLGCNGQTGTLSAPICPSGFVASGDTCVAVEQ
ncbi:nuclease-related domain-containing protein [Robbsia sp. KACC 23696]|uniref:nuclease-related domain-containing protein n=1 Tax=Robbsia sp. KACC 23696 TaxID=3149231 RepID=UPI00325A99D9